LCFQLDEGDRYSEFYINVFHESWRVPGKDYRELVERWAICSNKSEGGVVGNWEEMKQFVYNMKEVPEFEGDNVLPPVQDTI
jgi:hypothetical protein